MSRTYYSVVRVDNNVSLKMANSPRSVLGAVDQRLRMQVSAGQGWYSPMHKNTATPIESLLNELVGGRKVL